MSDALRVRQAQASDQEAVAAFTGEQTWPEQDASDYLPAVFPEWVESDDERRRTFVAERDGQVVGIIRGTLLTAHEGWAQGIRVAPAARGTGVGTALVEAVFEWARERGATVVRNLVFDWNGAGMGQSRSAGFDPCGALRFAYVEPDTRDPSLPVSANPDGAWQYWMTSDAREVLGGLGFDFEQSWALAELTRERLHRAADEERAFAVESAGKTRAMSYRSRQFQREDGNEWAEYGAAGWQDKTSARALFAAIAADAAELGVDRARVAVPETARHVSESAVAGAEISEEASFVFGAEL